MVERDREAIINTLLQGLCRLEYRGYDSAGLALDSDTGGIMTFKQVCFC